MPAPRRFDHDDAIRRYQAGESYAEIAASVGVTDRAVYQAIRRATDLEYRERSNAYHRDIYQRTGKTGVCVDCGTAITRHYPSSESPGLRCKPCDGLHRRVSVRETELRCGECGQWKPDRDYPHKRASVARRDRHSVCRPCQTLVKRRQRQAIRDRVAA